MNTNKVDGLCDTILENCEKIWCISFRKCEIVDEDIKKLLRYCKKCKNLKYLNLNVNIITNIERLKALTSCLPSLENLNTICLYSSNLEDDGLKRFFESIINHKHIISLDLGDCKLTDNSVDCINSLIYIDDKNDWPGLQELSLSANEQITPTGWYQILLAIAASSRLKSFYADYNNIDDVCGYLLVAIIASTTTLEIIDLEHTRLTNASAKLFCYVIENYPVSLKTLNLVDNNIKTEIIKKIDEILMGTLAKQPKPDVVGEFRSKNKKETAFKENSEDIVQEKIKETLNLKPTIKYSTKKIYEKLMMQESPKPKIINFKKNINNNNDDDDLLNPVDDLRFKTHHVLPFNLMN